MNYNNGGNEMIPKKYIIAGLVVILYQMMQRDILKLGKDIVQIMKLLNGMKIILI